jgi:hypothetical protein
MMRENRPGERKQTDAQTQPTKEFAIHQRPPPFAIGVRFVAVSHRSASIVNITIRDALTMIRVSVLRAASRTRTTFFETRINQMES